MTILNEVLEDHAAEDDDLKASAQAFASPGGATLGSGGAFFPQQHRPKRISKSSGAGLGGGGGAGGSSTGGASAQGGAGGAGVGGWVHLSDVSENMRGHYAPDPLLIHSAEEEPTRLWKNSMVRSLGTVSRLSFPLLTRSRPEDILGSVEVDSQGNLRGNFQPSGTYRIITNEGM